MRLTFENCREHIENHLSKIKSNWTHNIDFEEVKPVILTHIWRFWDKYKKDISNPDLFFNQIRLLIHNDLESILEKELCFQSQFQNHIHEIEILIERKRRDWTFKASLKLDFDDVKAMILNHIWKKWSQYDSTKPLGAWVNRIIKNQLINTFRNEYKSTSSPCNTCEFNMGNDACAKFKIQGIECPDYENWYNGKRHAHNLRMPLPLENHSNEVLSHECKYLDLEKELEDIHTQLKKDFSVTEWKIYELLYIQHNSEEQVIKLMNFHPATGAKIIFKIKQNIKKIGKKVIQTQTYRDQ